VSGLGYLGLTKPFLQVHFKTVRLYIRGYTEHFPNTAVGRLQVHLN